jgi:hypothetical protein
VGGQSHYSCQQVTWERHIQLLFSKCSLREVSFKRFFSFLVYAYILELIGQGTSIERGVACQRRSQPGTFVIFGKRTKQSNNK